MFIVVIVLAFLCLPGPASSGTWSFIPVDDPPPLKPDELREFLELKYLQYHQQGFIASDPVSIPHRYTKKQDIEISAFLVSVISWGQRPTIIRNSLKLMELMDDSPYEFILRFQEKDLLPFSKFVHRTFNGIDCCYFLKALQHHYREFNTLEKMFFNDLNVSITQIDVKIQDFRNHFFSLPHLKRTEKHLSDPSSNAACKRINMFLRWMVRTDYGGVDFGLWKEINPSMLMLPLDVHSGRVARSLALLNRKQDDWKAVTEVTHQLRKFDPADPVKYDFALFGIGINEKFS